MSIDDPNRAPRPIGTEIFSDDGMIWIVIDHETIGAIEHDVIDHVGDFRDGYLQYLDGRREYVPDWQI